MTGYVVERLGVGRACFGVAGLLALALLLLCCVPSPPKAAARGGAPKAAAAGGVVAEVAAGLAMAWHDPAFMSFLGVTWLGNMFYWSHLPILQVLGTQLGATAGESWTRAARSFRAAIDRRPSRFHRPVRGEAECPPRRHGPQGRPGC